MIRVLPIRRASRIYKIGLNSWAESRSVVKFDLADRVVNFMRARMIPDLLVNTQFLNKKEVQSTYKSSRFNQIFAPPASLLKFSAR